MFEILSLNSTSSFTNVERQRSGKGAAHRHHLPVLTIDRIIHFIVVMTPTLHYLNTGSIKLMGAPIVIIIGADRCQYA